MKSQKRTHEVNSRALRKGGGRGKKRTKSKKQPTESKEIKGRVRYPQQVNNQVLCRLPDNVFTSRMLELFRAVFKVHFSTSVDHNGQFCVEVSLGSNVEIAAKVASLLQDGSEMDREAGAKPFGYTLLYVREERMWADKCGIPFLPNPAKLQQVRSAYGISAVLVRDGDLQEGIAPAFGVDCKPRPEGGRPRFAGPGDASETDGVLLWGQDHAVTAGLNGVRAVAMGEYDEVVLPLGPFITGKINLDDIKKFCTRRMGKWYGKVKLNHPEAGKVRVQRAVKYRRTMLTIANYLVDTVPSSVAYVEVGDAALMRQLVGTGTLPRLTRELQLEGEVITIPLWQCGGVLVVAPERVTTLGGGGLHVNDGGLRRMCKAISDDVTEWDKTHFRVQLNATGIGATRKDVAKGIKPKIVQDLCENVEGLQHLWLDGTMLRGRVSETKAVVMNRLFDAIMTRWSELFNLCNLTKAGIRIT